MIFLQLGLSHLATVHHTESSFMEVPAQGETFLDLHQSADDGAR
jgi:hypothetical protein